MEHEHSSDASTSPVLPATRHNQAWDELEQPRDQMTPEAENKLLARRFMEEVVNTGAVDRLSEFLATEYLAPHIGVTGIEQAREHMLVFRHCYPDMRVTVEGQIAEADIVATWYLMRGTHLGAYGGVPATGKKITLRAVNIQRIRNGRIVEHWGGSNSLEALLEIGIVRWASYPGPASPMTDPVLRRTPSSEQQPE